MTARTFVHVLAALGCCACGQAPEDQPATVGGHARWVVTDTSAGPVRLGMSGDEALVAMGLGTRAADTMKDQCEFIGRGVALIEVMLLNDTVVRIDVTDSTVRTAAGVGVGDSESRVRAVYRDRVRVTPSKYTDGHYLIVTPAADTTRQIIFEEEGGRVVRYRAGRLPAVALVERCG